MMNNEKALQYFITAIPENEEQSKAYFFARKALASVVYSAHIDRETWVSVEERLPEKQKDVLMLFDTGNMAVGFWHDEDEHITFWCAYTDNGFYTDCDCIPTHWMPLPEPPVFDD